MPETLEEFDNFSYELSKTGNVRYNAPDGYHDDIVIAHLISYKWTIPINH